ncbi:hypothetical protein BG004_000052 [Podila humilis]|nr:hypothetical protein BG004_000052 [Podila humilis]
MLIGVWSLLAVIHVLIVCGLVALPESLMDGVLVVGNRILEDPANPMKIVITSLYGVQCIAWCSSLACIAIARAAASDPTLGFEIQNPKSTQTHRLEMAQHQRMQRRRSLFGFRPSVIAPSTAHSSKEQNAKKGDKERTTRHQQNQQRQQQQQQQQQHSRPSKESSSSRMDADVEGQTIFIPNDRRISQVVVTFRSDLDSIHMNTFRDSTEIKAPEPAHASPPHRSSAGAVYITNHNYGPTDSTYTHIPFSLPGESLSDMIFSAAQSETLMTHNRVLTPVRNQEADKSHYQEERNNGHPQTARQQHTPVQEKEKPRLSESSVRTASSVASTTITKKSIANSHSNTDVDSSTTTLDDGFDAHQKQQQQEQEQPETPMVLSKEQVQQLEKIQQLRHHHQLQHQSTWQLLMEQDMKQGMVQQQQHQHQQQQEVQSITFPIVPTRRSSFNHQHYEKQDMEQNKVPFSLPPLSQTNASDPSHELFSISTADNNSRNTAGSSTPPSIDPSDSCTAATGMASHTVRTRSGISSLKYWKKNRCSDSSVSSADSNSGAQHYFANTFSSKKTKSKKNAIQIPCIVLHPDEEDGEPPRLLTQKDIEYLSTAPPAPLRLIEPWDEEEEGRDGQGYEDDYGDGYDYEYDYESYHQQGGQADDEEYGELEVGQLEEEEAEADEMTLNGPYHSKQQEQQDKQQHYPHFQHDSQKLVEHGYEDPYALDVPINLEIDLQGLEHGEVKAGYGYF